MDTQMSLADLARRISELEAQVRRLEQNEGRWSVTNITHPVSTNLSNIREAFLLEIIRENGLLDGVDLEAIEAKIRTSFVNKQPWGASEEAAAKNLDQVVREIKGETSAS